MTDQPTATQGGPLGDPAWHARNIELLSAPHTPEPVATPLVGTGELVVLRLSAAGDYLRLLKQQSSNYYTAAADHLKVGRHDASNSCLRISEAYDHASEEFRRLMASSELRQPQGNTQLSGAPENKA